MRWMVKLEVAIPEDAEALTAVQKRAFDHEFSLTGETTPPDGYDNVAWQIQQMSDMLYYKITESSEIVGGIIVSILSHVTYHVVRLFVDPIKQGQGFGAEGMLALERLHPNVKRWQLNTPARFIRSQRFYEGLGYRKIRIREMQEYDLTLIDYEKVMLD
jgi:RimJ/RimL family protein N-acetyltransferase